MNPDRLPHLATQLRALADRLDTEGPDALQRAHDWLPGPQPGDRHETLPQPGDPDYQGPLDAEPAITREQATDRKLDRRTSRLHSQLHEHLDRLASILDELRPARENQLGTPTDAAAAGYCRSCWRNNKTCRDTAKGQYRDYCWWCGSYKAEHHTEPPLWLLERYHRHGRVSAADRAQAARQTGTIHHGP